MRSLPAVALVVVLGCGGPEDAAQAPVGPLSIDCPTLDAVDQETLRSVARWLGEAQIRGAADPNCASTDLGDVRPAVIRALVACEIAADVRDPTGATPLHTLTSWVRKPEAADIESAALLLEAGVDIEARRTWRWQGAVGRAPGRCVADDRTALLVAVSSSSATWVEFLLDRGAKPDGALHRAMDLNLPYHGSDGLEITRLILEHGAAVDALAGSGQQTALHLASMGDLRHPGHLALLLEHGADANIRDGRGRLPLHYLVEVGASYAEGRMALDPWTYHPELLTALARATRDLDARDDEGLTPLQIAVKRGRGFREGSRHRHRYTEIVARLIELGADQSAIPPP